MARPKSAAVALRNDHIYALWKGGKSLAWLAEKYERTPQQIGRIVASFHPDIEDDDDRALHRGRLEALFEEIQGVVNAPGFKLAPNGRLAEGPDDEPLEDTGAKIEALKVKLQVLESMRRLDARDRPQKKEVHFAVDVASQQAAADIARRRSQVELAAAERRELEELRRQQKAVPGEVIRELPAS